MGVRVSQQVQCLVCSCVYTKPMRGGTYERNPGCPRCGYLGWTTLPVRLAPEAVPLRVIRSAPRRRAQRA